jgi:ATP-dependent helicase/nuclease subunit B
MPKRRPNGASDRRPIVVRHALAARQWELHLAASRLAAGERAWISPPVIGYRAWTEQLLIDRDSRGAALLSPLQSATLWRQIIAESPAGASLVSDRGAASWAAEAWSAIHDWRIDTTSLLDRLAATDVRAFAEWCDIYRTILADHGWSDRAQIEGRLATLPGAAPSDAVVADLGEPTPARKHFLAQLETEGWQIERWSLPASGAATYRSPWPDERMEILAAASWARGRLERGAAGRVALVVPGLEKRAGEVARLLEESMAGRPVWLSLTPADTDALVGAALTGIELLSPRATFATLSRWLRSPLFGSIEPAVRGARAALEVKLRSQVRSQLPFHTAYRRAGLSAWLSQEAPAVAGEVAGALAELGDAAPATPGRWGHRWQRALARLKWPRPDVPADDPSLRSWQSAIDDFAKLTPVTGKIDANRALEELERVVRGRPTARPLPTNGLHLFAHPDDVGPGYDATWVTGMTDAQWPEPVRPNPLLPRALQRELVMPWSTPADAERRSARSLERLKAAVPLVVFSWPHRVYDYETEPSPALSSVPDLPRSEAEALLEHNAARRRVAEPARETLPDPAPPLPTRTLRGGTGLLRMQARCPLRAFCQYRLGARPILPLSRGLSERARGVATHRALELLFGGLPGQAELDSLHASIASAAERALQESFGGARAALHVLFEIERTQLTSLLSRLLEADARRGAFSVLAIEDARDVRLGEWTIRTRVDRADALAAGGLAVIDYKTGERSGPADWLTERLHDAQVPLYAVTAERPVAATVIAKLHARDVSYAGFWSNDAFPNRARALPDGRTWQQQLAHWRAQIMRLVEEFAAGDTRLLPTELDEARGTYAPLSRVAEQLALNRGGLSPW